MTIMKHHADDIEDADADDDDDDDPFCNVLAVTTLSNPLALLRGRAMREAVLGTERVQRRLHLQKYTDHQ